MDHRRVITRLPRDLERLTGATVPYRRIYNAAVNGLAGIEQADNGRWVYDPANTAQIAQALGLVPSSKAAVAA